MEKTEKQIQHLIMKGVSPVIYCKRQITDEVTDEYLR
jgi:hypothetical protein